MLLVFGGFAYSKYAHQIEHFIEIAKGDRRPLIQISGRSQVQPQVVQQGSTLVINDNMQSNAFYTIDDALGEDEVEDDVEDEEAPEPSPATNMSTPTPTATRIPWFLPNYQSNAFLPLEPQPTTTLPTVSQPMETPLPSTEPPKTTPPPELTTRAPTPTPTFDFAILRRKNMKYTTEPPQTTEPPIIIDDITTIPGTDDGLGELGGMGGMGGMGDMGDMGGMGEGDSGIGQDDGMGGMGGATAQPPEPQPKPDDESSSFATVPPDSALPDVPVAPAPDTNNVTDVGSTLGEDEAKRVLAYHNEMRAKHGAPPLEWDSALARIAQKYIDTCPLGHSDTPYGENLAWGYDTIDEAALDWYNEEFDFKIPTLEEDSGHFTQIIWMDTKRLGCGKNMKCDGPQNTKHAFACYYDPSGNEIGVDWSTKVKPPQ